MNRNKQSNLHKILWRHLRLFAIFIITVGLLNFSCSKKSDTNNDQYYVKYEVNSSSIYYGGTLNVGLKGEDNQIKTFTINTRSPWETTIGPVKKGFVTNLNVSEIETNYGHLKLQVKISINKNGSPFALKKSDESNTPRTSAQINYTIDY